jgi:hypothetical protein
MALQRMTAPPAPRAVRQPSSVASGYCGKPSSTTTAWAVDACDIVGEVMLMCEEGESVRSDRPRLPNQAWSDGNPPHSDAGVRDAKNNEHHVGARRRVVRRQDLGVP